MKIAIIVPMEIEAEYYRNNFHSGKKEMFGSTVFEHFSVNENDVYIGLSGIGKVQAAMNLASLLACQKIDQVFLTGSAGSMDPSVHKEDVILVNSFAYHDAHNTNAGDYVEGQVPGQPARFMLDSAQRADFAKYLVDNGVEFHEGLVVTGDSFISSQKQKEKIKHDFPDALGVEMEGAAFAQVARQFDVPFVALRAISDNGDESAEEDFDDFVKRVGAKAATLISDYIEKMK